MSFLACRAGARRLKAAAVVLALAIAPVAHARAESENGVALPLDEAANLAVTTQPLLTALEARQRAALESAVAAGQLPDPQLIAGIRDLPVNTGDAYSFRRDSDTQILAGVMQEFPRASKRRLRAEQWEREAESLVAEHGLISRSIRRDASLAWLELWRHDRTLLVTRASLREAQAQMQLAEIALKTGSVTQAEFLAARQESDRLHDAVAGAEQGVGHARIALSRWIGSEASRPVLPDLPEMPILPELETVLERLQRHPDLAAAAVQVAAARTGVELAKAAYKPDWRVELGYGYRPAFSEMLMLQVAVDLPVFRRNRQDRGLSAALAQTQAAESDVDDVERQLMSEARLSYHDFEVFALRLKNYDTSLLPQSENRVAAALAGWRSGRGMLRDVFDARRAALDLQIARLDLEHELARRYVQLTFLGAFDAASDAGENGHE